MPEFMGVDMGELFKFVTTIDEMELNGSGRKTIQAFFDMGCSIYGKNVVTAYMCKIEAYDLLNKYAGLGGK